MCAKSWKLTFPEATAAVKLLKELGIVTEVTTGREKNRSFSYSSLCRTAGKGIMTEGAGRARERASAA